MEHYKESIFQKLEDKVTDKYKKAKAKVNDITWRVMHDEQTQANVFRLAIVGGVVAHTVISIKKAATPSVAEMERRRKERTYYDPHTQLRYDTRRELTNEERYYVREQTRLGRRALDVLRDMGLSR